MISELHKLKFNKKYAEEGEVAVRLTAFGQQVSI
jgi:hypothetical protein